MSDTGTILIVDDEPTGRMLLESMLQSAGYQCAVASSGAEALQRAAALTPDLILLDVMMTGMDGFEVCQRLRATPSLAEVPIILITALDDRDSRIRGFEVGADDFLTKPVNLVEIKARVRTITRLNRYRQLLSERARFDRLIELSPDGILIVDATGSIHLANPAMVRMLRASDETTLTGQHVLAFITKEHADHCTACLHKVITTPEQVVRVEMELHCLDGTAVPVEINIGHFVWQDQAMVQMIARDITERKRATEQLQIAHRVAEERAARFRLLVEMGRDLISAHRLHALLNLALERAIMFSGYNGGSILLLDPATGSMEVRAAIGAEAVPPGTQVDNLSMSISGQVLQQQELLVLEGRGAAIGTDWRTYTRSIPSTICLPLIAANERSIGVLALKSTSEPRLLSPDDLDALQLFAAQLAVMIEYSQLYEENMHLVEALAERERRLQDLVEKLLVSQEEERRRVAYELHDGLAQVASSAYQHLQTFASYYHPRSQRNRQQLEQALGLTQRVVKEARQVIAGLRPTVLDDFGLASAIRLEVERLRAEGWDILYDDSLPYERLPPTIETAFFRVAQEALNNMRKHAGKTNARVALYAQGHTIHLEIQDWGKGFAGDRWSGNADTGEHVGLIGMQERMTLLGGQCHITSSPGAGTHIVAKAPLPAPTTQGMYEARETIIETQD